MHGESKRCFHFTAGLVCSHGEFGCLVLQHLRSLDAVTTNALLESNGCLHPRNNKTKALRVRPTTDSIHANRNAPFTITSLEPNQKSKSASWVNTIRKLRYAFELRHHAYDVKQKKCNPPRSPRNLHSSLPGCRFNLPNEKPRVFLNSNSGFGQTDPSVEQNQIRHTPHPLL